MADRQSFTVFRTQSQCRCSDAGLEPIAHVSAYPAFGVDALAALDEIMAQIAEQECDEFAEIAAEDLSDPCTFEATRQSAIETPSGTWEIFRGALARRPDGADPVHCYADTA